MSQFINGVEISSFEKDVADGVAGLDSDILLLKKVMPVNYPDAPRNSHDAETNTTSVTTPVLLKTITMDQAIKGGFKSSFDMKRQGSSYRVYGQLYKNGSPLGTLQESGSTSYASFTELHTVDFAINNTLELWGYIQHSDAIRCYVKNLRIYYDADPSRDTTNS